jgi:phosphate transport system permease protein
MTTAIQPNLSSTASVGRPRSRAFQRIQEGLIKTALVFCGGLSITTTLVIVILLVRETIAFFGEKGVTVSDFLLGTVWSPLLGSEKHFGIWPLVCGTLLVTTVAMALALPLGLITAIYMSEYASRRVRAFLKPALEVLAGVPTVVFGFFALTVITPALQWFHEGFNVYNAFSAGLAVGIMCLPIVSSLTEDALQAVPRALREGGYALGSTKFDVSVKVVVPAAMSGIVSAFLLATTRAIGETMIVALAAGSSPKLTLDPRSDVQTMTGYLVQIFLGDASNFGTEYRSSYAVATALFVITLALTILGHRVRVHFREVYE